MRRRSSALFLALVLLVTLQVGARAVDRVPSATERGAPPAFAQSDLHPDASADEPDDAWTEAFLAAWRVHNDACGGPPVTPTCEGQTCWLLTSARDDRAQQLLRYARRPMIWVEQQMIDLTGDLSWSACYRAYQPTMGYAVRLEEVDEDTVRIVYGPRRE